MAAPAVQLSNSGWGLGQGGGVGAGEADRLGRVSWSWMVRDIEERKTPIHKSKQKMKDKK